MHSGAARIRIVLVASDPCFSHRIYIVLRAMSTVTVVRQVTGENVFRVVSDVSPAPSISEILAKYFTCDSPLIVARTLLVFIYIAIHSALAIAFVFSIAHGISNTSTVTLKWLSQLTAMGRLCWPSSSPLIIVFQSCLFVSVAVLIYTPSWPVVVWIGATSSWSSLVYLIYELYYLITVLPWLIFLIPSPKCFTEDGRNSPQATAALARSHVDVPVHLRAVRYGYQSCVAASAQQDAAISVLRGPVSVFHVHSLRGVVSHL